MTPEQAYTNWLRCRPYIEAALDRGPGLETIEDVEHMIEDGRYVMWAGRNCCAITMIEEYAEKKVISIVHAGGDGDELRDEIEPMVCAMGRDFGCDTIAVVGRKGWEHYAKRWGYRHAFTTWHKDLYT